MYETHITLIVFIRLWTLSSSRTEGIGLVMTSIGTLWTSSILSEWIDLLSLLLHKSLLVPVDIVDLFLWDKTSDLSGHWVENNKRNISPNKRRWRRVSLLPGYLACLHSASFIMRVPIGCSRCRSIHAGWVFFSVTYCFSLCRKQEIVLGESN